jgi:hypothetical protein
VRRQYPIIFNAGFIGQNFLHHHTQTAYYLVGLVLTLSIVGMAGSAQAKCKCCDSCCDSCCRGQPLYPSTVIPAPQVPPLSSSSMVASILTCKCPLCALAV